MSPCLPKWVSAIVFAVCCSAGAVPAPAHEDREVEAANNANIDIDEIARRLTRWRDSFSNIRIVWETRKLPKSNKSLIESSAPPDAEVGALLTRTEWIWADNGLELFEERSNFYDDGESGAHSIEAHNGPKGAAFTASFRRAGPHMAEEFTTLGIEDISITAQAYLKPHAPLKLRYWVDHATRLPEVLSGSKWEVQQIEEISGSPCARIARAQGDFSGPPGIAILWIDLDHDCLVRRDYRPGPNSIAAADDDFIVDEFQRLDTGVWLPKRGRIQLGGSRGENRLFLVTEAGVNEPLDLSRFGPPAPAAGTAVEDHGRSYVHGAPPAQSRQIANKNAAGDGTSGAFFGTLTSSWRWWAAAGASAFIICMAVGSRLLRQVRAKRR